MTEEQQAQGYEGWAIVELMGHRQTAGFVRDVQQAGVTMLRIDTPGEGEAFIASQFYGGAAIYCLTPCDEKTARQALDEIWQLPPAIKLAVQAAETRRSPQLPFDPDRDRLDDQEPDLEPF